MNRRCSGPCVSQIVVPFVIIDRKEVKPLRAILDQLVVEYLSIRRRECLAMRKQSTLLISLAILSLDVNEGIILLIL